MVSDVNFIKPNLVDITEFKENILVKKKIGIKLAFL